MRNFCTSETTTNGGCLGQSWLWVRVCFSQRLGRRRMGSDVTWRMVTSSTRRRERTWASVDEQNKMADWVVSTSHSRTWSTLYSHHLVTTNTTSSSTSTVTAPRWYSLGLLVQSCCH